MLLLKIKVDMNSDIHEIRSKALQNFEELGFPTKKLEAWKYTSLNSVLKEDYSLFPEKENTIELADVKKYFIMISMHINLFLLMENTALSYQKLPMILLMFA